MTVDPNSIDLPAFMAEHLQRAEPDLLRSMLSTFVQALMSAEADAICGAPYGERSPERTNSRNGNRARDFDTRTGSMEVAIPKLREGSYFPDWLLERRRRAERALTTVVATCYLLGVSTRRMEKLVETLGITRLSKSQVSVMARELDAHVADFRTRPLDKGPYTFLAADALTMPRMGRSAREEGWSTPTSWSLPASTPMGPEVQPREIIGLDTCSAESEAGWLTPVQRPERPRPVPGQAGHLGCAQWSGRRDDRHLGRRLLATMQDPLRGEPDVGNAKDQLGLGP